jgi:hypothetical protein
MVRWIQLRSSCPLRPDIDKAVLPWVAFEPLMAAPELVTSLPMPSSPVPRRHRMEIKACEQIGSEIGHSLNVSVILYKREPNCRASWQ